MKKSRILGYALTLAATLFVGSAMGQITSNASYSKVGTASDEGDANNKYSYVTVNKAMKYEVIPDAAFHPGYAASGTLTSNTVWKWTIPGSGITTNLTALEITDGAAVNYVQLTATTAGIHSISVAETANSGFGSCAGSSRSFKIVAFETPTITLDADNLLGKINKRDLTSVCGPVTAWNINLTTTASDKVQFSYTLEVLPVAWDNLSSTFKEGTAHQTYTRTSTSLSTGGPFVSANDGTWTLEAGKAFVYATDIADGTTANLTRTLKMQRDFDLYSTGGATPVVDDITLYRYTFKGISDFVSRKSQVPITGVVPGTFTMSDNTDKVILVYVKRAPKTGPVYHIGNNIAI